MTGRSHITPIVFYTLSGLMAVICVVSFVSAVSWINKPFAGFLTYKELLVGSIANREWPGTKAGLKFLDKIVAVDGQPVSDGQDLIDAAAQRKPGDLIHYTVESGGKTHQVSVPVTIFSTKDFLLIFFITFLGGVILFALGVIVFVLKPNMHSSWVFFYVCLSIGAYMVSSPDSQTGYLLNHINTLTLSFFPATVFHFFSVFPDRKRVLDRMPKLEYLIYVPASILAALYHFYYLSLSGILIPDAITWRPDLRMLGALARFFTLFCAVGMITFLIHSNYRAATIMARQRARMIAFGVFIGFGIPVFLMVAVYFLKVIFPWNFLVLFVIIFPATIAYSIIRHNLFDADTIIRQTVGYVLVTAAVVGAYGLVTVSFNVFMGKYQVAQSRTFPILFTLGVILVFNPLRNRIQILVDRLFFRKDYDYQEIMQKISETMRSLLNQNQICKGIMKFALEPMFVDSGSVMILNKAKNEYECFINTDKRREAKRSTDDAVKASMTEKRTVFEYETTGATAIAESVTENSNLILSVDEPLMRKIAELKKEITLYDIKESSLFESDRQACEQVFERLGASLIVPLIYENRLSGVITMGQKKSGKFYNREDINLLTALASQGALAIENARMVEEIIEKERIRTKILDAFGKYVTPEVRDQILAGKIPLDGESKEVTVLFADLRDFTTLAESTTPKEVVRIINGYFSEMADAIGQNHGLVLQFIGDEIEAVFGAPLPLENHPTHAVRAALAMRERLVVVNENLKQQGYGPLRHGIGIHTGDVVAANIGSEDRLSYAMVGDTVNVASRIQGLNKELGTDFLISATTVEKLVDNIEVEKLPATTVKGKRDPVNIYKLKYL